MRSTTLPALLAAVLLLVCGACVAPPMPPSNTQPNVPPANTNASTTAPAPTATERPAEGSPVTLAVLDALLYDPAFAKELEGRLGLSAEEVEKLRRVASDARSALSEEHDDVDNRSTSAAERTAVEELEAAVGKEKAARVLGFAAERWTGSSMSEKPGAVPNDTRVVVNTPAYRLDVFESGKLVKTYKVGIGYPEFPLPQGLRAADEIILNPTWTPPDEPWVKGKVKPGERIEAGDPRNPLGPIKVPIGLPSLIHGGKPLSKIGTFASHGCVGMTTPQIAEFAALVARLGDAPLDEEQLAEMTKRGGETKSVKLARSIPVELRYETIVVEDGRLHVYRDVYDRRTNTEAQLRTVLEAYGVSLDDLSAEERAQALQALEDMSRPVANRPKTDTTEKRAKEGKVTTAVKGKKEAVVEIAALAEKGYPTPVDLNDGGGSKQGGSSAARGTKQGRKQRQ
jgi:lipoprotein-anchoring transpeptidase ErfK/SrfK